MAHIGIILVCTRKYDQFLQQFIDAAEKYFFQGEEFNIYLLTDNEHISYKTNRCSLYKAIIPSYTFPWATLYRYKQISFYEDMLNVDYVFYSDIDMRFVTPVGEEILCDGLTAVRHPGFHMNNGWGSPGTPAVSMFYVPKSQHHDYYAGGFQGGSREEYLECASTLSWMIDKDLEEAQRVKYTANNGIFAQWHDESAWNWYLKNFPPKKILSPEYCMVEQEELRKKWGIDNLTPRLLALAKNHAEIRS